MSGKARTGFAFYPVSIILGLLLTLLAGECRAAAGEPLVVGVREVPPFVMRQADGEYTGISIDLWRQVARDLGQ